MDRSNFFIIAEILVALFGGLLCYIWMEKQCDDEVCNMAKKQKDNLKK